MIVAGRSDRPLHALPALASACNYPLLADPLSGARSGDAAVAHYDLLLRDDWFASAQRPEVVIRVGDLPTSKQLRGWLADLHGSLQITIDPEGGWQDPAAVVERSLRASPELLAPPAAADPDWLAGWRERDARIGEAVARTLGDGALSELGVAQILGQRLPDDATLFVAASMPVREIEMVWPVRPIPPRVLSNRGANGIDGTLSSAFGASAAGNGPVVALIGDVAFAHDIGGLLAATRLGLVITIVLLDNGGGGIFDHLAVAGERDVYETHVATPTGIDFAAAAQVYGLDYAAPGSPGELERLLARGIEERSRATLLHVTVERAASVELHRRLVAATSQLS